MTGDHRRGCHCRYRAPAGCNTARWRAARTAERPSGRCGLNCRASISRATGHDVGAAAWPVTASAIGVVGVEPGKDAGAVQEIVHQRVDRDHAGADFRPGLVARAERPTGCRTRPWSAPCPTRRKLRAADRSGLARSRAGRSFMRPVRFWNCRSIQPTRSPVGNVADEQIKSYRQAD